MSENSPVENEKKILIVDDEEAVIEVTRSMLEYFGYEVEVSLCPMKALEIFKNNPSKPDLVITDLKMPRMNGEELVAEIRKIRTKIPVIFMTGTSYEMESSTEIILEKPFSVKNLQDMVHEILNAATVKEEVFVSC